MAGRLARRPRVVELEPLEVDLSAYDKIQISSSAGKDSEAMLFYVAGLLRERGLLGRGVVIHADMGRAEWPGTLELAAEQARLAGLEFRSRARAQGDLFDHILQLGKFPTPSQRFCTSDHKRQQILVVLTAIATELRALTGKKRPRILNCVGLRAEESPGRAAAPTFRPDARGSSRRKQIDM
jgi:3'-phosphoadenosine 5'-phosphosulfate sulfotransferase (PAPS reductase)/FAD synthetase